MARRLPCDIVYVGGKRVQSGLVTKVSENLFRRANPWNGFGYQAFEEAVIFQNNLPQDLTVSAWHNKVLIVTE